MASWSNCDEPRDASVGEPAVVRSRPWRHQSSVDETHLE